MKLEPVFLVAPPPAPKSMPTRRAWLVCTASAIAGLGTGFAIGSVVADPPGPQPADPIDAPAATGDETLTWLLALARPDTPLAEQLANLGAFVYLVPRRYAGHRVLWDAMGRMADDLLAGPSSADRRRNARDLGICFESHAADAGRPDLVARAAPLLRFGGR